MLSYNPDSLKIESIDEYEEYLSTRNFVYNYDLITSTVSRSIEHGYLEKLSIFLPYIDSFREMCSRREIDTFFEYRLTLRRIRSIDCYILAKTYGFVDDEFEKRIVMLQRAFRGEKNPIEGSYKEEPMKKFRGPVYEEYDTGDYRNVRYWGYRQMMYQLRWDRKGRLGLLKRLHDPDEERTWHGDCRHEAWLDLFGRENGNMYTKSAYDF